MLYGVGIPILFPIAVISYIIFYMLERYCMAYTYQMPPSLDDRLTKNAVSILKFAPILLLFNGFWMLSNEQIFNGKVNLKDTNSSVMITGHNWHSLENVDQATPVLFMGIACFVIFIMQKTIKKKLKAWGFGMSAGKIVVDENLPNFFEAVKLAEADWITKENEYYRKQYGLKMLDDKLHERLDDTKLAIAPI